MTRKISEAGMQMALGHMSYTPPFSPQNRSLAALDVVDSVPEVYIFIRDR